jgi:hypothetical protein
VLAAGSLALVLPLTEQQTYRGTRIVSMFPKEHGAYGQITFPLVAAFGAAGVSKGGLFVAAAVIAGFLAHEPAAIVLGLRGPRAKRELWQRAVQWLGCCLAIVAGAGIGALLTIDAAALWSLAIPLGPAFLLMTETARGHEKSWQSEVAAALAFSGAAVPVSLSAGAALESAAAVAIPFALLFVASTLAVRVVILRVRRGGDSQATSATRRAVLLPAGGGAAAVAVLTVTGLLSASVLIAAAPGLLTAAVVASLPPAPTQLRRLGWTLVAVSVVTTAIVVATA